MNSGIILTYFHTMAFSPTCMKIMDFFLENPTLYFTPMTVYKSEDFGMTLSTVQHCMNLLLKNSYLTKEDSAGSNHYNITKENMEFWVTDFRNYILALEEIKDAEKIMLKPMEKNYGSY